MNNYTIRIIFEWRFDVSLHIFCGWSTETYCYKSLVFVRKLLSVHSSDHTAIHNSCHSFVIFTLSSISFIFGSIFHIFISNICLISFDDLAFNIDILLIADIDEFFSRYFELVSMIFGKLPDKNGDGVNMGTSAAFILQYIKNIKTNDSSFKSFDLDSK